MMHVELAQGCRKATSFLSRSRKERGGLAEPSFMASADEHLVYSLLHGAAEKLQGINGSLGH